MVSIPYFCSMKNIFYFVSVILFLVSCEKSDFSINDDYEETPVIYAVLDASESRHYVKVSRGFLSSGNAFVDAENSDSTLYAESDIEEIYIVEKAGEQIINTYNLTRILLDRDPYDDGDFNYDKVVAYYFDAILDQNFTYHFHAKIKGKDIYSFTELVKSFRFKNNYSSVNLKLTSTSFKDAKVEWENSLNAQRYDLSLVFNYREYYADNSFQDKQIRNFIPASNIRGTEFTYSGESIFRWISNSIDRNLNVVKRVYYGFGYEVSGASENLDLYLSINELDGYNQEKPFFTNIEGGVGLFVSKYTVTNTNIYFQKDYTALEFVNGLYTGDLKFCFSEAQMLSVYPSAPDFVSQYNRYFCN